MPPPLMPLPITPGLIRANELFPYRPAAHYEVVTEPLERQVVDGYLPIGDKPGLGVELNDDFLAGQMKIIVR